MGKAAKEHRKKVQSRNNKLKAEKTKTDKFQKEFIMNLIKQEQEKGLFDNNPSLSGPSIDGFPTNGPSFDGFPTDVPSFDGFQIDGSLTDDFLIDGPSIDGPLISQVLTDEVLTDEVLTDEILTDEVSESETIVEKSTESIVSENEPEN
jgi:hypothetical protein